MRAISGVCLNELGFETESVYCMYKMKSTSRMDDWVDREAADTAAVRV